MKGFGYLLLCAAVGFFVFGFIQDTSIGHNLGHPDFNRYAAERAAKSMYTQIFCFSLSGTCLLLGAILASVGTALAKITKQNEGILSALQQGQKTPEGS